MSVLKYKINKIVSKGFEVKNTDRLDNINFSMAFQFKVNVEEEVVCCISNYEYKREEEKIMLFNLECYFQIESQYFTSLIKDKVLTIKTDILQYLATIAVGTARGEIHARCERDGSALQGIVLPQVDLTKIIRTPAKFII